MAKIIVELCQNHRGDRGLMKEMITSAKENGADIVKGQIIFSDDLTHRERFDQGIEEDNGVRKTIKRPYEAEYARLKTLDLKDDDYVAFVEEANRIGVQPMMTVFSRNRIPLAASLPLKERMVKVASYDCGSHAMVNELANHFDTLIVSTGASFDDEIKKTAELLKSRNKKFALLHCVTSYPNTLSMCNLARMEWLRTLALEVGWSDHTLVARDGIKAAKVGIMLGADYIERHFTILPSDQTKDGPVSITPALLKELAAFNKLSKEEQQKNVEATIPEWRTMVGTPTRDLTHIEMLNRDYYRGRFASNVEGKWIHNWESEA
ncbi:MAG: N-acetylneuraminate synthase family protein [Patescibacteria group bacterium]